MKTADNMSESVRTKYKTKTQWAIFGAGACGRKCLALLQDKMWSVLCFLDNNAELHGKKIEGTIVLPVNDLKHMKKTPMIVIAVMNHSEEIREQLRSIGIKEDATFTYNELFADMQERLIEDCMKDIRQRYQAPDGDKLRILYDGQPFSFQKMGGISRYFYEIIRRNVKCDDISIDLFQGLHVSEVDFTNVALQNYFSWNARSIFYDSYEDREVINRTISEYYASHAEAFDIYHPTYYADYGITQYKKLVITVHDMIHELFHMDERVRRDKKNMVAKADGIIAVSENTKKDLTELFDVADEKIRVIYEANALNCPVQVDRIIKEPYILYVGTREEVYKNFRCLLVAYGSSAFRNELKLVCFGGGALHKNEQELISDLGLVDHVIQISGTDEVLSNLYQHTEVFVYPSQYEGFGLPILEAMYCGAPVLTANVSSIPEVAGDAAVYFDPSSAEDLKEKLDNLLSNNKKRQILKQMGKEQEKRFSWDRSAKETHDYYFEVMNR